MCGWLLDAGSDPPGAVREPPAATPRRGVMRKPRHGAAPPPGDVRVSPPVPVAREPAPAVFPPPPVVRAPAPALSAPPAAVREPAGTVRPPPDPLPVSPQAPAPDATWFGTRFAAPEDRAPADTGGAPPAAGPPPAPADPERPDPAHLSLRVQGGEEDGPAHARVAAGGQVTFFARVRNQSGVVDNYDVRVDGFPPEWWTIVPATVYLLPIGSEGMYEGELQITLHPPRSPEATATTWPFDVVATSRAFTQEVAASHGQPVTATRGLDVASARGSVEIEPFTLLRLAVRPERVRAWRRARFDVAVRNRGNAMSDLELTPTDTDDACRFIPRRREVMLGPNEGIVEPVVVRPRRPLIIGRAIHRPLAFAVRHGEAEEPAIARATFVQRPWLPWWILLLIGLLAIALALLLTLRPIRVPDVRTAASASDAQRVLEDKDLRLDPVVKQLKTNKEPAGSVVTQSPNPGTKVDKHEQVTITVAVAPDRLMKIPDLTNTTIARAETLLTARAFTIGLTEPSLDPKLVVRSQIPKPGLRRAAGTPVNLFLGRRPRRPRTAAAKAAAAAAAAKKAAAAAAKKELTKVPEMVGSPRREAAEALDKAGLRLGALTRVITTMPRGTVVASRPVAGTEVKRGRLIPLRLSAGFPRLAFGDGRRVLTAAGAKGADPWVVADDLPSRQPAWSADGRRVAYVADGRILIVAARDRTAQPVALTPRGTDNFARPTIAPEGVLAFLRARAGDGDLCFARVEEGGASVPDCIEDARFDLAGRPEFSPRGTTVLVPGIVAGQGGGFGIVRYRSATPFSTRAEDWGRGTLVTARGPGRRGVIRAAYSPGGTRLAMVTNLGEGGFRVVLTTPDDLLMREAQALPVAACDVAWRPDGLELAVVTSDPQCNERVGSLIRVRPDQPDRLRTVRAQASDPVWQPVDLGCRFTTMRCTERPQMSP